MYNIATKVIRFNILEKAHEAIKSKIIPIETENFRINILL